MEAYSQKGMGFLLFVGSNGVPFLALCNAEKMSGQTTQLRGINTQYESIGGTSFFASACGDIPAPF